MIFLIIVGNLTGNLPYSSTFLLSIIPSECKSIQNMITIYYLSLAELEGYYVIGVASVNTR